ASSLLLTPQTLKHDSPLFCGCLLAAHIIPGIPGMTGAPAMATINTHRAKDGTLSYRVRIRMRGQPTQSASFPSLKDARRWAAMIEGQMIEGRHFPEKKSSHTLSELRARYYKDVHPKKSPKTRRREAFILRYWDDQLGYAFLSDIQPRDIIQCRDRLSTTRKPGTIHMYLAVLSHVFTTAVREYQWLE